MCKKKYSILWPVFFFSIYGICLRLMKLHRHTLWGDEYFQLEVMKGSFWDLLKALPKHEYCSYLSGDFYLTYPFFKLFSYNKWGLAIPHIISSIIGFYVLYLICKRYFKTVLGYLVAFSIMCFNATLIWHATEIRTYAVLPTLALSTFYLSGTLLNEYSVMSKKKKILIGAFFVFVIWFHLYGIFMPYLSMIFLLITKFKNPSFKFVLRRTLKFMGIVSAVALPFWIYCIFGPHVILGPEYNIDTFLYIPNPLHNLVGFLKGIFGNLIGNKKLYFLLIGLFYPFFISYRERYEQILFFFLLVFIPIAVIFLSDLIHYYYFIQRQFIWVMPYFAFFLGWTWDSLFEFIRQKILKKRSAINI